MRASSEAGEAQYVHSSDPADDLTDFSADQLRKLTDKEARIREENGHIYANLFRQLQIKPGKYETFYEGTLRVVRNKHIELLKRGTSASLRTLTDLFLRGHGYLVWTENSIWQLDNSELGDGEVRLTYQRRPNKSTASSPAGRGETPNQEPANPKFYEILHAVWYLMRNTIFELKVMPKHRRRLVPKDLDLETDCYVDADSPFATPQMAIRPIIQTRTMCQAVTSSSTRSEYEAIALRRPLTTEEAEAAIMDLITHLHIIRSSSNTTVFDELFARQLARVEELEVAEGFTDQFGNVVTAHGSPERPASPPMFEIQVQYQDTQPTRATQPKNLSNEPWMTDGNPLKPVQQFVPPTIPSLMSIYISSARASPYLTTSHLTATDLSSVMESRTTMASLAPAYHWPGAPVMNEDMTKFFAGINNRIEDPLNTIVGYMFSYGWNDTCRFVSSGLQELAVQDKIRKLRAINGEDGHETYQDLIDPRREKWEPEPEQWQYIRLGWADFQNDVTHAARLGVSVWRMKVCVLVLNRE
ncbi:hypothetical protein B0A52_10297 [Exophiala mesophila]|uniref:Uncharacterized protein n=1 Tax=Exophiala mesophila TaxID=212818 RepID=A0A438MQF3_EXOME|nr:hypothetical protein B0A52_10297 [Exophiala mesophila]